MAHRRVAVLLGAPRSRTETVNVMHGKKCVYPMDCLRTTESRGSSKSRFFPRPDGLEPFLAVGHRGLYSACSVNARLSCAFASSIARHVVVVQVMTH